ncbi:MAG: thioesterase family protein [Alphaproteobacteria bacterium]
MSDKPDMIARPALASYPFVTVHPIRYGDLDPNNHVNNAVISTYCEIGRTEFFAREGLRLTEAGRGLSLVRTAIDFHREILYPGFVEIATGVKRIGNSSVTFDQAIFVAGQRHVSAEAIVAQIDLTLRRSSPWTDEQRRKLETLLVS